MRTNEEEGFERGGKGSLRLALMDDGPDWIFTVNLRTEAA